MKINPHQNRSHKAGRSRIALWRMLLGLRLIEAGRQVNCGIPLSGTITLTGTIGLLLAFTLTAPFVIQTATGQTVRIDPSFKPTLAVSGVMSLLVQPDQKIVIGQSESISRLVPDGQAGGSILVAGGFNSMVGTACRGLIRLVPGDQTSGGCIQFATNAVTVAESAGVVTLTVQRIPAGTNWATVNYATQDYFKFAGLDYRATNGTLTFGPDEAVKTIQVELINNTLCSPPGSFLVVLSNPAGGVILGTENEVYVSIEDDDTNVGFSPATYRVREHIFTKTCDLTVLRQSGKSGESRVNYATRDLTAKAGFDYEAVTGNLVFVGFETTKTISVPIHASEEQQGEKTFEVFLSEPAGALLPTFGIYSNAVVTIADDNGPGGADATFVPNLSANGGIYSVDLLPDNRVILGGFFSPGVERMLTNGILDTTFSPWPGEQIYTTAVQADGSVLAAGWFQPRVWRIRPSGWLDNFDPQLDGPVRGILVQADQKVIVLGDFTTVNGRPRRYLARLNTDGSTDAGFDPGMGPDRAPLCVALQPDSRILLGGNFTDFNGQPRKYVARLKADGSVDDAFDPGSGPNAGVQAIAVQPDRRILIGGFFTQIQGQERRHMARLEVNGILDTRFDPGLWVQESTFARINRIALQADGKVMAGGGFTYAWPLNSLSANDRYGGLVRFNANGSLDEGFLPILAGQGTEVSVNGLSLNAEGKIYIGGAFSSINGYARLNFARLNNDPGIGAGSVAFVQTNFVVPESVSNLVLTVRRTGGSRGAVLVNYGVAKLPDAEGPDVGAGVGWVRFGDGDVADKLIVIPVIDDTLSESNKTYRACLGNPVGGAVLGEPAVAQFTILDNDINVTFNAPQAHVSEGDGFAEIEVRRIGDATSSFVVNYATRDDTAIAGGDYAVAQGQLLFPAGTLAKTIKIPLIDNTWGQLDRGFDIVLSQPSGGVTLGRFPVMRVVIVDDDRPGSLDSQFNRGANPMPGSLSVILTAMALLPDGRILVGGQMLTAAAMVAGLVRLLPDGAMDSGFGSGGLVEAPFRQGSVTALAATEDGRIVVGGQNMDGACLLRLSASGVLDTGFQPALAGTTRAILLMSDGRILVGGQFVGTNSAGVLRLKADGSLDASFTPVTLAYTTAGWGGIAYSLAFQGANQVLVGGDFGLANGVPRGGLIRLNGDGSLDTGFAPALGFNSPPTVAPLVRTLLVQRDQKVLLSGQFTNVSGSPRCGLARLNPDGSLDRSFDTGRGLEWRNEDGTSGVGQAVAILEQGDGKLLIAGHFNQVNGQPRAGIARLGPNGSLDAFYDPNAGLTAGAASRGSIEQAVLQADGRLLVGGSFEELNGTPRIAIARLNAGEFLSLQSIRRLTEGATLIGIMAPQPAPYILQRSANLKDWVNISTNTLPVGRAELRDDTGSVIKSRFYRLLVQP